MSEGLGIGDALGLSDDEIKRIAREGKDGFDEIPDRTWALLRCNKASAKISGNKNLCFDLEHSAIAFPSALSDLRLGTPKVWDNGRLLVHPGDFDLTGQTLEYAKSINNKGAMYLSRLRAYAGKGTPLEHKALTLAEAESNAPLLIGGQVLALLKVLPAGREYTKQDGSKGTAQRSKIEIDRVEAATPEALAKRGIEKPEAPF